MFAPEAEKAHPEQPTAAAHSQYYPQFFRAAGNAFVEEQLRHLAYIEKRNRSRSPSGSLSPSRNGRRSAYQESPHNGTPGSLPGIESPLKRRSRPVTSLGATKAEIEWNTRVIEAMLEERSAQQCASASRDAKSAPATPARRKSQSGSAPKGVSSYGRTVNVDKLVQLVQSTFVSWNEEHFPKPPPDPNELPPRGKTPSERREQLQTARGGPRKRPLTSDERHELFLNGIAGCTVKAETRHWSLALGGGDPISRAQSAEQTVEHDTKSSSATLNEDSSKEGDSTSNAKGKGSAKGKAKPKAKDVPDSQKGSMVLAHTKSSMLRNKSGMSLSRASFSLPGSRGSFSSGRRASNALPRMRSMSRGSISASSMKRSGSVRFNEPSSSRRSSSAPRKLAPKRGSQASVGSSIQGSTSNSNMGLADGYRETEEDCLKIAALYQQVRPEITNYTAYNHEKVLRVLQKVPHLRTPVDVNLVYSQLRLLKAFEKISRYVLMELITSMYVDQLDEGTCVFKQGDVGTAWFVVLWGGVQIYVSPTGGLEDMKPVRALTAGSGFGDLALMSDKPRAATVMTITKTILARVEKDVYNRVMKLQFNQKLQVCTNFLRKVPPFDSWPANTIRMVAEVIQWSTYQAEEVIVEEGARCTNMFFLKSGGPIDLYRTAHLSDGSAVQVKVAEIHELDYFNENLALDDRPDRRHDEEEEEEERIPINPVEELHALRSRGRRSSRDSRADSKAGLRGTAEKRAFSPTALNAALSLAGPVATAISGGGPNGSVSGGGSLQVPGRMPSSQVTRASSVSTPTRLISMGDGPFSAVTARVRGPEAAVVGAVAIEDAKNKLFVGLQLKPVYRYSNLVLIRLAAQQREAVKWRRLRAKHMNAFAREITCNPHATWSNYLGDRRYPSALPPQDVNTAGTGKGGKKNRIGSGGRSRSASPEKPGSPVSRK